MNMSRNSNSEQKKNIEYFIITGMNFLQRLVQNKDYMNQQRQLG